MKYILLSIFTIGILTSCDPKSNYIDTGISNGKHDCSMLEYFHTSSYNWDSLLVMIQHAELESLFEGREPGYEQITFWGPTNHSIRRYTGVLPMREPLPCTYSRRMPTPKYH